MVGAKRPIQIGDSSLLMTSCGAYPRTPPPGNRRFYSALSLPAASTYPVSLAPKGVTKPEVEAPASVKLALRVVHSLRGCERVRIGTRESFLGGDRWRPFRPRGFLPKHRGEPLCFAR
jgi:hypothetical protein